MPIRSYLTAPNHSPVKIWTKYTEPQAELQLRNIAALPFIHSHIAAMPDVHLGKGATVGSVIATRGAIIPAAVGVDIGCGMMAAKLNLRADQLPDNLGPLRSALEAAVPHGRTDNGGRNDRGAWGETPIIVRGRWNHFAALLNELASEHPKLLAGNVNTHRHLGTLGTGNHFIELCLDENDDVWLMLHSGSRGIGNRIGQYFIELAKEDMRKWFINLPDEDLAYLPEGTTHFTDYVMAVSWAQNFASENRKIMFANCLDVIHETLNFAPTKDTLAEVAIDCHHNYVDRENHFGANVLLTRKGAIRARVGDLGIIPGSMGAKSFIVRGKGNPDSFNSCSHGAGRKMSRSEARRTFTLTDLATQTAGIECRKDLDVIDEIPGAYKDIDEVMDNQSDLVEVVHTLKQVLNIKG